MLDENLIATLETSLRQTRNAQNRLMARLREVEAESELLRVEIEALENSASQTESAIDSLLVNLRSGSRQPSSANKPRSNSSIRMDIGDERLYYSQRSSSEQNTRTDAGGHDGGGKVAYIDRVRNVPSRTSNIEPLSQRFADRTITQACRLLLREAGRPLHVNELYNLLASGGMEFKGNNPTISVAVSLNRNNQFRKVKPGTFDLAIREASRFAS